MSTTPDGASLRAHFAEPAVDLATLVEGLAEAAATPSDAATRRATERWPLLTWNAREQVLALNTRAPLARFWRTAQFRHLGTGFLRDAPVPKSPARAHLGGQIVPGSEGRLRTATQRLVRALDAEIDAALGEGFDLSFLAGPAALETLQVLGKRLGCRLEPSIAARTHIERVTFAPVGTTQQARRSEAARVMAALDVLDGDRAGHIANFMTAVRSRLHGRGFSERDIDAALHHHTAQAQQPGTQLARFFDFLEDEALARIRVEVGCRMMEALAGEAAARRTNDATGGLALLAVYVRRALGLWGVLRAADGPEVLLHLSGVYGEAGEVVFQTEAITAGFGGCLPVWPAWEAQLFEDHQPGAESSVSRELSYRFRVNGREPMSGKPAYAARLDRFERDWLLAEEPKRVRRSLAELVFLGAVVPRSEREDIEPDAVVATARELIQRLEQQGREGIAALIEDLRARERVMARIGSALIGLLKSEGTAITRSADGRVWDYHLNVLRSLVDWQRIASSVDRPLAADPSPTQEPIDFFRAMQITPDRGMAGSLFSTRVRVRLSERSLCRLGEAVDIPLTRRVPERLLQVVWRPYQVLRAGETATWTPHGTAADEWLVPNRVDVQYDPRTVGDPRGHQDDALSWLAASRTALAVLVYTALLRLLQRVRAGGTPPPTVSMLRLQQGGRETSPLSGEAGIFAAAQAVEAALGRDVDLRMQGIVLDDATRTSRSKRSGIYAALLAGFPLRMGQESAERPPIGVVSFAARPCNDHPDHPTGRGRQLFLSRSYLASPIEQPMRGYEVGAVSSRTEVAPVPTILPETVHEEIRRLHATHGCRHVVLLGHRFAERRVGRQAGAARLREQGHVLRHIAEAFPDLVVYPLVRDTFPATRIRGRAPQEDAFEVLQPDEHLHAVPEAARPLRRAYTPVYSLATLHVVGETAASAKPQSGFCTYFLPGDDGTAPIETLERMRANLLLSTSPVRASLLAALRSIHYLEAERAITGSQAGRPVLDPYDWMAPDSAGKVGEVLVFAQSRRRPGTVALSLTALLDAVSRIVHAPADLRDRSAPAGDAHGAD